MYHSYLSICLSTYNLGRKPWWNNQEVFDPRDNPILISMYCRNMTINVITFRLYRKTFRITLLIWIIVDTFVPILWIGSSCFPPRTQRSVARLLDVFHVVCMHAITRYRLFMLSSHRKQTIAKQLHITLKTI